MRQRFERFMTRWFAPIVMTFCIPWACWTTYQLIRLEAQTESLLQAQVQAALDHDDVTRTVRGVADLERRVTRLEERK